MYCSRHRQPGEANNREDRGIFEVMQSNGPCRLYHRHRGGGLILRQPWRNGKDDLDGPKRRPGDPGKLGRDV